MYACLETGYWVGSMSKQPGYIYRFDNIEQIGLRGLIKNYVKYGRAFEGNIVSLSSPKTFYNADDTETILLSHDFGYAFGRDAEVRWRRTAQDRFEVLLLTEQEQHGLENATPIGTGWWVRERSQDAQLRMTKGHRVGKVEYMSQGGNGAVQFVRYKEVEP